MNNNKKIYGLFIVSPIKFADKEYFIPKKIFEKNNIIIQVASTKREKVVSMKNIQIEVDLTFDEIEVNQFDFIIIVGGFGVKQYLWDNLMLHKIIIGAICLSPVILAKGGILNNKKATVFRRIDALKEFAKFNIEYINKDVVVAGNIITANSPRSSENFAKAVLKKLNKIIYNNEKHIY